VKIFGLAFVTLLSLVLVCLAGPVVQANSDNATVELKVEIDEPATFGGSGGGGISLYRIETNLFGIEKIYYIEHGGSIWKEIEGNSQDGNLTITISEGTIALDEDGKRLETLGVVIDETPPDPPEDSSIIGLAYDFSPDGATFDPPITLTWSYDPEALPEGVAEEDLVIAYYDEAADEWVELDCVVDTANNIITAEVNHFTTSAIIGTVPVGEEVVGVPIPGEEEVVVVVPDEEEVVSPTLEEEEKLIEEEVIEEEEVITPDEEEEDKEILPEAQGFNWPLTGGLIAGAVIVVTALILYWQRKRQTG